jgi:hypothetical protein
MTTTTLPWPTFRHDHPTRYALAYRLALAILGDMQWHPYRDVAQPVIDLTGLQPKTIQNLIRQMVRGGGVQRRGRYRHPRDSRHLRLAATSVAAADEIDATIADILGRPENRGGLTQKDLVAELHAPGVGRNVALRAITKAIDQGLVSVRKGPGRSLLHFLNPAAQP